MFTSLTFFLPATLGLFLLWVSEVLQPVVCGDEGLRILETSYRPLVTVSEGAQDFLQDGDSPVGSSLGSAGQLDGVSRLEGCLFAGPSLSGQRQVAFGRVSQFKALCFSLSMAPQVFTRVMAPVSAILHRAGIHICRYLDDWLIQASSRIQLPQALDVVLRLCHSLGIIVNWEKSHKGDLSWRFLDLVIVPRRDDKFLSYVEQPTSSWLELLGVLSFLIALVSGGHLKMRSLQLLLSRLWDHRDDSVLVRWDVECRRDLEWWLTR